MQRFWNKTTKTNKCWLWNAAQDGRGYGAFRLNGKTVKAYKVAYNLIIGEVPDGLQLDHLCRNRLCVNPYHLEPVTQRENILRGIRKTNITKCPKGHNYSGDNLYIYPNGRRDCKSCRRIAQKKYLNKKIILGVM